MHPDLDEGSLAKRRAGVVSTLALAEVARRIGLGEHVLLGRGEDLTGGRDKDSILADTMEAVIGATYLSAGPEAATALVLRLVEPLLDDPERYGAAIDPKTSLQELASRRGAPPPVYAVTSTGPDHDRSFLATVHVGEVAGEGTARARSRPRWPRRCAPGTSSARVPELPEVEVVRAGLAPAVTGALVLGVTVLDERALTRHTGDGVHFEAALTGRRIVEAARRGKFLWLPLEGPDGEPARGGAGRPPRHERADPAARAGRAARAPRARAARHPAS